MPRWPLAAPAMPSTLSRLMTMSAMMIVFTASQKLLLSLMSPSLVLGQQQLDADPEQQHAADDLDVRQRHQQRGERGQRGHQHDDAAGADDERVALLACGGSDRQASAMTTRVVAAQHDVDDGDLEQRRPDRRDRSSAASMACAPRLIRGGVPRLRRGITRRLSRAYASLRQAYPSLTAKLAPDLRGRRVRPVLGKRHGERVADAVDVVVSAIVAPCSVRDLAHDREPQAAAVGVRCRAAGGSARTRARARATGMVGPVVADGDARRDRAATRTVTRPPSRL